MEIEILDISLAALLTRIFFKEIFPLAIPFALLGKL